MIRVLSSPGPDEAENPYNRLLFSSTDDDIQYISFKWTRAFVGRYDLVHIHWPDGLLYGRRSTARIIRRLAFILSLIRWHVTDARLVWTVHNNKPHEPKGKIDEWLLRSWARQCDALIFLSQASLHDDNAPTGEGRLVTVIRHGAYRPDGSRAEVDIVPHNNDTTLLFFGNIRTYKGVEHLIDTFSEFCDQNVRLIIAGRPSTDDYGKELTSRKSDQRIQMILKRLSDAELTSIFNRASGVILPYLDMGNSGALFHALTYGRPALVPDTAANRELRSEFGDWVCLYASPLTTSDLERFTNILRHNFPQTPPDFSTRRWVDIGRRHSELYRALTG